MGADVFDLVVVISLCWSLLSGFLSGFVIQFARLFSLVGAFWAMRAWTPLLAPHLGFVADPSWRTIAAGAIIFIGVMILIGVIARILKKIIAFSFGGWIDKLCGAILGLGFGILFWAIIMIVLDKLFPDAEFLRNSRVIPYFDIIVEQIRQWLPADLAKYLGK